jgi:hypothetical protein
MLNPNFRHIHIQHPAGDDQRARVPASLHKQRGCRPDHDRVRRPRTMNAILNAFFVLARAQLVDQRPELSPSDSTEETGVQLTTFRTHSAPDPIAEPLYEPPLVYPFLLLESEKGMMYGSTSTVSRGHVRGSSSVRIHLALAGSYETDTEGHRTRRQPSTLLQRPQMSSMRPRLPEWKPALHSGIFAHYHQSLTMYLIFRCFGPAVVYLYRSTSLELRASAISLPLSRCIY